MSIKPGILDTPTSRFTLAARDHEIFMAVAKGLADIFSQDRRAINAPHRFHPDKRDHFPSGEAV